MHSALYDRRFRSFLLQNGISANMDVSGTRKRLENILLLLIESGLFYCILQVGAFSDTYGFREYL